MKPTIVSISTTFVIILAGIVITTGTPSIAKAETTASGGATCPAGYVCTPITSTRAVTCPAGYVCTPRTTTTSVYRPGTLNTTSTGRSDVNQALTPAQLLALSQGQASTTTQTPPPALTQAQLLAIASSTSTGTSTYAEQVAREVNAIVAKAPTSWPTIAPYRETQRVGAAMTHTPGFDAPVEGGHVKSVCGPNQFFNSLTKPFGCVDNFATNAPIVLNPAVPFDLLSSHTITDPYCPGLTANEGIGSSQHHLTDSTKTGRATHETEGIMDPVWQQKINCFVGEAYKNQPYVNPWVTVRNLFGINQIYLYPPRVNQSAVGTNFCKDAITLPEAKKRNDQQLAAGIHNDLYTSNSRLYVPPTYALSLDDVENMLSYFAHAYTYFPPDYVYGTRDPNYTNVMPIKGSMNYWWNGAEMAPAWDTNYITFYKPDDIKNPEFLALFNAIQFEQLTASNVPILQRCMDSGYVSNLLPVIGHYQSEIMHDKKLGLIQ